MKPTPPTHKRRPMAPRYETQRQLIARLLLLGWPTQRIATRVSCTARMVRSKISEPAFQTTFAELQREHLKIVDRKISHLLHAAVRALARLLKHSDWRARDAAVEKILKMHARYVERINVTGTLEHTGQVSHGHPYPLLLPLDDMTPEQRTWVRQLLQSTRATQRPRVLSVGDDPPGEN